MVYEQSKKWQKGKLDRQMTKATVPGKDGEDKKRGRECGRKSKIPKCLFQRWVKGYLDQRKDTKPAENREDLLINGQEYPLLRIWNSVHF